MRMCMPHWEALRTAIGIRGLTKFVSKGGEEAAQRLKDNAENPHDANAFDPLLAAHNMILSNAIDALGFTLFEGDKCPLCEMEKTREGVATEWIGLASDGVLAYARELGLVPEGRGEPS